jgi:Uma2 family endonuclease
MGTLRSTTNIPKIEYPTSDGKPMAETPRHRDNLAWLIEMLRTWYLPDPMVYVSGNMLLYYVPGNKRKHVSPDVFVVRGIPKTRTPERGCYLLWEEGKGPEAVIELTSKSTRHEDLQEKFHLYQDVLKVREYFLFDPNAEYLQPPLQGYRLRAGKYVRIRPAKGRLPSQVLGLHLEADGWQLRLYDPAKQQWLPTPPEERTAREQAERERHEAQQRQQQAEAEVERLRRELDILRRRMPE